MCVRTCNISMLYNNLSLDSLELSTTNNPPPVPSSTKIHPSGVDEGQEASQLNQTKSEL